MINRANQNWPVEEDVHFEQRQRRGERIFQAEEGVLPPNDMPGMRLPGHGSHDRDLLELCLVDLLVLPWLP